MRFLILIFGLVLLFGCTTTTPVEDQPPVQPPADNQTQLPQEPQENDSMTCTDYCQEQPHIECIGQWNITGEYPDCNCEFICGVAENDSEPDEPEDLVEPSNKTLNQMLEESLSEMRLDFYKKYEGSYEETQYTWKRSGTVDSVPGEIVLDAAPVTDVKFDGNTITSIQAAAFIVFDDDIEAVSRGMLVFMSSTPVLPEENEFDIEYFHSTEHRYMEDCKLTSTELSRNTKGDWVTSSYVSCMSVDGVEED